MIWQLSVVLTLKTLCLTHLTDVHVVWLPAGKGITCRATCRSPRISFHNTSQRVKVERARRVWVSEATNLDNNYSSTFRLEANPRDSPRRERCEGEVGLCTARSKCCPSQENSRWANELLLMKRESQGLALSLSLLLTSAAPRIFPPCTSRMGERRAIVSLCVRFSNRAKLAWFHSWQYHKNIYVQSNIHSVCPVFPATSSHSGNTDEHK